MKRTIKIPMLIGPNGHYTAYGWGNDKGDGVVDTGLMWDNTEDWPCSEGQIRRVNVSVEVEFPDATPPTLAGKVEP